MDLGIAHLAVRQVLAYLMQTYARVSLTGLTANRSRMVQPFDFSQPIETLFKRMEDGNRYAIHGQDPFTQQQLMNMTLQVIQQAGAYTLDMREWNQLPAANKNWMFLKTFFINAQRLRNKSGIGAAEAGFVNNVERFGDAVEELRALLLSSTSTL